MDPETTKTAEQSQAQAQGADVKDGAHDDGINHTAPAVAAGVGRVEAFNKVLYKSGKSGRLLLWLLGVSVGLTMFAYAIDQGITTTFFTTLATSTFGQHSALAAVTTASQIIRAITKPFIGKLADITSRPTTYTVIIVFYLVGFIVAASSRSFAAYTVGICFTAVGKSGLDLLSDIIVGDLTPLQWRGFFGALLSVPFVVTVPINGFIAQGFEDNWRWGLGMFAILIPALMVPAIVTLYVIQGRGERMGMVTIAGSRRERVAEGEAGGEEPVFASSAAAEETTTTRRKKLSSWTGLLIQGLIDIDMAGLILLGVAFALILLPFTLAEDAPGGWADGSILAMLVVGFVLLIAFSLFEIFLAPKPLMTRRIMKNRAFVAAVIIDIFNQTASSVRNTYFSSYVYVIKDWTTYQWTIFLGITTMGLSLLGPFVGLLQRRTHRYKTMMLFGAGARLIGNGLLVTSGSNNNNNNNNTMMTRSTARLTASQLLVCLASFNVVGARVGSQASVPHEDMASVIALLSLWSTLGSSVGSAIAAGIWTGEMKHLMYKEMLPLPLLGMTRDKIDKFYGSITDIRDLAFSDPVRQAAIRAYAQTNGYIAIAALVLAAPPLVASFFMPDYYLGKQQNAVTNRGLDGERVQTPPPDFLSSSEDNNDNSNSNSNSNAGLPTPDRERETKTKKTTTWYYYYRLREMYRKH